MVRSVAVVLACVLAIGCTRPAAAPSPSPSPTAYRLVHDALVAIARTHVDTPSTQRLIEAATTGVRDHAIAHAFTLDVPLPRYDGDDDADRVRFETYVDEVRRRVPSLAAADLERAAVVAMTKSLGDCFSSYDEKGFADLSPPTSYGGIGAQLENPTADTDRAPWILTVFPGSPAERAGLARGDRVLALNDQSVAGYSAADLADLLRGPIGSAVDLTLLTGTGTRRIRFERAQIDPPPVISRVVQDRFGYLVATRGGGQGRAEAAAVVLRAWNARGVVGWVLDLREQTANDVNDLGRLANLFIETGAVVVQELRGGTTRSVDASPAGFMTPTRPLAVLVSPATQEGALVLATALRESAGARVIGEASRAQCTEFGQRVPLARGTLLVTVSRQLSRRTKAPITGIEPDETVRSGFGDPQLAAALRWLASVAR